MGVVNGVVNGDSHRLNRRRIELIVDPNLVVVIRQRAIHRIRRRVRIRPGFKPRKRPRARRRPARAVPVIRLTVTPPFKMMDRVADVFVSGVEEA